MLLFDGNYAKAFYIPKNPVRDVTLTHVSQSFKAFKEFMKKGSVAGDKKYTNSVI